jgi:hypothetical protein
VGRAVLNLFIRSETVKGFSFLAAVMAILSLEFHSVIVKLRAYGVVSLTVHCHLLKLAITYMHAA